MPEQYSVPTTSTPKTTIASWPRTIPEKLMNVGSKVACSACGQIVERRVQQGAERRAHRHRDEEGAASVQMVEETVRILVHSDWRTAGTAAMVQAPLLRLVALAPLGARGRPVAAPSCVGAVRVVLHRTRRHLHERLLQRGTLRAQLVQHDPVLGGQFAQLLGRRAVDLQAPLPDLDRDESRPRAARPAAAPAAASAAVHNSGSSAG